ncbi:MAG: helix-turn-helix transcriptional regulator, partial [Clostridia bacterium]|nr:helix-turn-helix transcriptional regulator [Clostridia bacterium]
MQIGNTIRTRRRQKDMTQEQLAEKMCVSISAVSQ